MKWKNIINGIFELLFPKRCLGCNEVGSFLCGECLKEVRFLEKQLCPNCKKESFAGMFCRKECGNEFFFDQLIVCSEYEKTSVLRKLITTFKYKFVEELCTLLGEMLRTQMTYFSQFQDFSGFLIVPVPLHKKRLKFRGFNQAKVLGEYLGKIMGIPLFDCLKRVKFEKTQAKLKRKERLSNLKNAFEMKAEENVMGKSILLLDDVATTGTTLNECSRILKDFGAKYICCLTIARGA
jgi:competence protein ComFC